MRTEPTCPRCTANHQAELYPLLHILLPAHLDLHGDQSARAIQWSPKLSVFGDGEATSNSQEAYRVQWGRHSLGNGSSRAASTRSSILVWIVVILAMLLSLLLSRVILKGRRWSTLQERSKGVSDFRVRSASVVPLFQGSPRLSTNQSINRIR